VDSPIGVSEIAQISGPVELHSITLGNVLSSLPKNVCSTSTGAFYFAGIKSAYTVCTPMNLSCHLLLLLLPPNQLKDRVVEKLVGPDDATPANTILRCGESSRSGP